MTNCAKVRALNDAFRKSFVGGKVLITSGIAAMDDAAGILGKVASFDAFTDDNDPHAEHDFGAFEHAGSKVFWKIDYYDRTLTAGSPNPSDTEVTTRVMTVMLAEEY